MSAPRWNIGFERQKFPGVQFWPTDRRSVSYGISRRDWQSTAVVIKHPCRPTSYRLYLYYVERRRSQRRPLFMHAMPRCSFGNVRALCRSEYWNGVQKTRCLWQLVFLPAISYIEKIDSRWLTLAERIENYYRKPSLEVAPTTLTQRTRQTTNNTSPRNVHP